MVELKKALQALGVKGHVVTSLVSGRLIVYVNGEYFGIWDAEKKTFVD